jgi:hypothetical protein
MAMTQKQALMIGEGITHKNILPKFGTNNKQNSMLEDAIGKFMYGRKPITENDAVGTSTGNMEATTKTSDIPLPVEPGDDAKDLAASPVK